MLGNTDYNTTGRGLLQALYFLLAEDRLRARANLFHVRASRQTGGCARRCRRLAVVMRSTARDTAGTLQPVPQRLAARHGNLEC